MEETFNNTTATDTADLPTLAELENALSVALIELHFSDWFSARDGIKALFDRSAFLLRENPHNTTIRAFARSTRELKNDAAQHTRDADGIQPLLYVARYKLNTYCTGEYNAIFDGTRQDLQRMRESGKESVETAEKLMKKPIQGKIMALNRFRILEERRRRLENNLESRPQTAERTNAQTTGRPIAQTTGRPIAA
jgi:hypothetical protein